MVSDNASRHHTNFTVSIEAAEGVTTGISAHDRAHTIRTAVRADARPVDLVQPGHIFPLAAQPGGVLTRTGHTEAASDLAALAGLEPAGVLVEILAEDGTMARRPQLEKFAKLHGLKIGSIADLIRYRLETEKTVTRMFERNVDTEFGSFCLLGYRDVLTGLPHFALVRGTVDDDSAPILTRVHVRDTLADVLHLRRPDRGISVAAALRHIAAQERGLDAMLLSHALLRALWAEERNTADPAVRIAVAEENGLPGKELIAAETTPKIQNLYRGYSEQAETLGVFGAPTCVLNGERFWGQDRLDFLDRALDARSR